MIFSAFYYYIIVYPVYQRFFSRTGEFSVLAEGRHIFGRRPKPRTGHHKDLRETGNRARKVSGTQGNYCYTLFESAVAAGDLMNETQLFSTWSSK